MIAANLGRDGLAFLATALTVGMHHWKHVSQPLVAIEEAPEVPQVSWSK